MFTHSNPHVRKRSRLHVLGAQAGLVFGPCETKVRYLRCPISADEDIAGLQISMDNVQVMQVHLKAVMNNDGITVVS